jgi:hypothetical protein
MSAFFHSQLLVRLRAFMRAAPNGFAVEDANAVVAAVDRFFDRRCSLDEAFGVRRDRGENHPGTDWRLAARNAALCAAGAMLGEVNHANSKKLAAMFDDYARSRDWNRHRSCESCPPEMVGRIEEHFWQALRALESRIRWRQIHETLAAQRAVKSASDCTVDDSP